MATVILLRPFVFSRPSSGPRSNLPTEIRFTPLKDKETGNWVPTPVDIPDEVFSHPYISEDFADGCIERPEKTRERLEANKIRQAQEDEIGQRELKRAQDAFSRSVGSHAVHEKMMAGQTNELNTPVNQIRARRGQPLDDGKVVDTEALHDALNTPVNVLQTQGPPPLNLDPVAAVPNTETRPLPSPPKTPDAIAAAAALPGGVDASPKPAADKPAAKK